MESKRKSQKVKYSQLKQRIENTNTLFDGKGREELETLSKKLSGYQKDLFCNE